jgi:hypothetical protein
MSILNQDRFLRWCFELFSNIWNVFRILEWFHLLKNKTGTFSKSSSKLCKSCWFMTTLSLIRLKHILPLGTGPLDWMDGVVEQHSRAYLFLNLNLNETPRPSTSNWQLLGEEEPLHLLRPPLTTPHLELASLKSNLAFAASTDFNIIQRTHHHPQIMGSVALI